MEELERFMPGLPGEIWYEHWHRYHFVAPLAEGKRVLDIACGEGYGSAFLATRAAHVTGVDLSAEIIAHARKRYGAAPNLEYVEGRCEAIPAADASVDLLISFETLEHIPAPEMLADEAKRVLKPDGLFVVSTPNKEIYTDRSGYRNPHHLRELYRDEFDVMMRARFPAVALLGQRVDAYSAIFPMEPAAMDGQLLEARSAAPETPANGLSEPMYFIAACGRDAAAVRDCARRLSLLSDRDHWVYEDYRAVTRKFLDLEQHAARIEAAYHAAQQQIAALSQERDQLLARAGIQPATPPGWRKR
jgi:SAM-dependent methyltransferase